MTPGLPEKIATAAYAGGFVAGVRWYLGRSRAVGDSDKRLWIEVARGSMGEEAAWGAAFAARQWLQQREALEATAAAEVAAYHEPNGRQLPELLARARHPGAVLAERLIRTARAARRAWEVSA